MNINENCIVSGVADDGRGVNLSKVKYTADSKTKYESIPGTKIALNCIDTVIYCTGYLESFEMLEESVPTPRDVLVDGSLLSKYWKMSKNELTKSLGDVPLGWIETVSPIYKQPHTALTFILTDTYSLDF